MKKISLVMLVVALCCVGNAQAAVYFQDDFESNTTVSIAAWPDTSGDYDPDAAAVGVWNPIEGGAQEAIQVTNYIGTGNTAVPSGVQPGAHSGDNYMTSGYHFDYYASWSNYGLATANLTQDVAKAVVDVWVWGVEGGTGGNDMVYMAGYSGPNRNGNGAFYIRANGAGVIGYQNGGWTATSLALNLGAWNHLVVDVTMNGLGTGGTLSFTLNDVTETPGAFYYQNDLSVGSVAFYSDTTAFFDDIMITPEPATMILLGLGGLGLLRRKHA